MTGGRRFVFGAWAVLGLAYPAGAEMKDAAHPFVLWTKQEAAALRKRIETDPAAKKQYERMVKRDGAGERGGNPTIVDLFNYMVMGDAKAGERQKQRLLGFIGHVPEPMTREFRQVLRGKRWTRGGPSFGDRHQRDEQTLNTLRYDVLYDQLTPPQREGVESALKIYIEFHLAGAKPWHPDFRYDRMSWLPNMHWPRPIGTHLMAVALKDEKLIDSMFHSVGGWKWYFDEYICDGRFYCEEFGKYYSNIGTMLMYCEALERLGLGRYGYGYTGAGGATMRRFLEMPMWLGYPRIEIPGGMPHYGQVSMGDAKGPTLGLVGQTLHAVVAGCLPGGKAHYGYWGGGHMNGPLPKLGAPGWFEVGHKRFPDAGFDYLLAQMRQPGEKVFYPSLYWGLEPIDPKKVKPPPVKSYLARERGFAFLRAEESPAYWEGPAPAVALQSGFYYVHYAHDCFSILGYNAFNRGFYHLGWGGNPSYRNASITTHNMGYIGGNAWVDTVRGYAGVVVDNLKAMPVDSGNHGLENQRAREGFHKPIKYAAFYAPANVPNLGGLGQGVYDGVDMERALLLAYEYLLDVFWLRSDRPRRYDWGATLAGSHQLDAALAWTPTSELNGAMLYREVDAQQPAGYADKLDGGDLRDVRKLTTAEPWATTVLQDFCGADLSKSRVGKAWYDRRIGMRLRALGEAGTTVFAGGAPGSQRSEFGGSSLIIRRVKPATTFVMLHEPFEKGRWRIDAFERIAQTADAVAVKVVGRASPISGAAPDDRLMVALGDSPATAGKPITLAGGGESFTFADYGFVRVGADEVTVCGKITRLKVRVKGKCQLVANGKPAPAAVAGGFLTAEIAP